MINLLNEVEDPLVMGYPTTNYKVQSCFGIPPHAQLSITQGKDPNVDATITERNGAFKISTVPSTNSYCEEKEFRRIFKQRPNPSYLSQRDDDEHGFHEVRASHHVYGDFFLPPGMVRRAFAKKPAMASMRLREDGDRMGVRIRGTSINRRSAEYARVTQSDKAANGLGQEVLLEELSDDADEPDSAHDVQDILHVAGSSKEVIQVGGPPAGRGKKSNNNEPIANNAASAADNSEDN